MKVSNALFSSKQDEILQVLDTAFQRESRIILTGNKGIGKTTLAQAYIRRCEEKSCITVRIDASTDETFLADLCESLNRFSQPADMAGGVSRLLLTLHAYLSQQQQALLVLDHLPFRFALQDLPDQQTLRYRFLLIADEGNTPAEFARVELVGLKAGDGARLLLRQAGLLTEQDGPDVIEQEWWGDTLELAREMRGSPLALRLAGGYIRQAGDGMRTYLDLFREHPAHLHLDKPDQQELEVAGELSLLWLERLQPAALEMLHTCALCLPEAIPVIVAQRNEHAQTEQECVALQLLVDMGLLDSNEDRSMLSMHPLLQQLTRQFCEPNEQSLPGEQLEQAVSRFRNQLPLLAEGTLPSRLRVAGQIRQLAKQSQHWRLTAPEVAEVFVRAATLLWEQHLLSQAEELLRHALAIWENAPRISRITIARALEKLAILNGQMQNYPEAEALMQRVITSTMAVKGVNHPEVLQALNQLGQYYAAQNKRNEAKACYEKVITMGEMFNLRLHPMYSSAKYNLAMLYIGQEDFERAEDLLLRVCVTWEHSLGKDNSSTVEARLKLAEVATRLKHWEHAHSSYQQVLPLYEKEAKQADPILLHHLEQAALAMFHLDRLDEAWRTWQRVMEARERSNDSPPLAMVASLNGLARVALAQAKGGMALELLRQAQNFYVDQDEIESLTWAETLEIVAEVYKTDREYEQAEQASRRALEMRERILGKEHLDLVENLDELARLSLNLGQTEQAEALLLRALHIYRQQEKPEDMRLDPVLNDIAEIEASRQRFELARMYLLRAQAIREVDLGEDDPHTLEIKQKIDEYTRRQEQLATSEEK